jgi:hypothetical protein
VSKRAVADIAALGVLAAGLAIGNAGCASSQPTAPANYLTCTMYKAGTVVAYAGSPAGSKMAGMWRVKSGRACSWQWPSEEDASAGYTRTWADPAATFTTDTGKPVSVSGSDQLLFFPGSQRVYVNKDNQLEAVK